MIDVLVRLHQPAGFDVQIWYLPVDEDREYQGEELILLDVIFCNTKKEANKVKRDLIMDRKRLDQCKLKGEAELKLRKIPQIDAACFKIGACYTPAAKAKLCK